MRWRPHCPAGTRSPSALAAGETPSPSMVAAAGGQGAWVPAAVCCLGIIAALVALFIVVRLADRTFFLPQAGLKKSPAVLADKAEHIIAMLAREPSDQEHWQGFAIDRGYLQYAAARDGTARRGRICPAIVRRRFASGIAWEASR